MIKAQLADVHLAVLQHVHARKHRLFLRTLILNPHLPTFMQILHFFPGPGNLHILGLSAVPGFPCLFAVGPGIETLPSLLEFSGRFDGLLLHEVLDGGESLSSVCAKGVDFFEDGIDIERVVVLFSEIGDDGGEVEVLLFHLLMVAAALFCLPRPHEHLHRLEDLVHASHVTIDEVAVVDLQEPVVSLVLLQRPMPTVYVLRLLLAPSSASSPPTR